jgi:ABC-type phosphate/phosphonate transport system permease subunit
MLHEEFYQRTSEKYFPFKFWSFAPEQKFVLGRMLSCEPSRWGRVWTKLCQTVQIKYRPGHELPTE